MKPTRNSWVLYIDIYGFKNEISRRTEEKCFDALHDALVSIRKTAKKNSVTPFLLSDSIFLISRDQDIASALNLKDFIEITCQVIEELVKRGFVPRGGISSGKVFAQGNTIVGRPVVDAVAIDATIGFPCVFLPNNGADPNALEGLTLEPDYFETKDDGLIYGRVILPESVKTYSDLVSEKIRECMKAGKHKELRSYKILHDLLEQNLNGSTDDD